MDERERRKQRRRKEAMRGRILAGVFLLVLAVGIICIAKGCSDKKRKAQQEADAQLKNLQSERDSLTHQVEALKEAAASYRTKFEALLQSQQEAIEKAADLF